MTGPATPRGRQDLSEGVLGVALLHIERGEQAVARRLLARAVADGVSVGGNASLFHGAPALEFVLGRAGPTGAQVRGAADRVVTARLEAARRRRAAGALPDTAEFDLIRGLAGLGALLLTRTRPSPLLREILSYLVDLASPAREGDLTLPGWWSGTGPAGEPMEGGHGNNGMAHGIAGPLALLALAVRHGVYVPGQRDALTTFSGWLDMHADTYWTTRAELAATQPFARPPLRPSWCYGRPGIARAQQLAALALNDRGRRRAAEDTVLSTLTNGDFLTRITDASLCHGWAGLLTLVRSVAADSDTPTRFNALTTGLSRRLAAGLDELPKPGFLEGRAGAQLALDGTDTTYWTRALLLT